MNNLEFINNNVEKMEAKKTITDFRTVIYRFSLAFTTCDCGKDIVLAQYVYGISRYEGSCGSCQKNYVLLNNKLNHKIK